VKKVCADAGFIIALWDERDPYHLQAARHYRDYFQDKENCLLLPWPILYESVRTRTVKNRSTMLALERDWRLLERQRRLELLDDHPYRDSAVRECFEEVARSREHYRPLSLADRVIRGMLADPNLRIDLFITFNQGDFSDICRTTRRKMLS